MQAEVLLDLKLPLAESPVWNNADNSLYWDDFPTKKIFQYSFSENKLKEYQLDQRPGSFALTTKNNFIIAYEKSVGIYDRTLKQLKEISPENSITGNHFNDGKCDANGRFWVGSMTENQIDSNASLYRVQENLVFSRELKNVRTSNGLCWNHDNSKFYYIDSLAHCVAEFDFNLEKGLITNKRVAFDFSESEGIADGMTIDKDGCLWIAHWKGSAVSRWNPSYGKCLEKYSIPAFNVTSCCFGGRNMDTLYITSARNSTPNLEEFPFSGAIFSLKTDTQGYEFYKYKED